MNKTAFTVLMVLTIIFGVGLTLTPYLAEWLIPAETSSYRTAKEQDIKHALAQWFKNTPEAFSNVNGLNRMSAQGNASWFSFNVSRQPVEQFIQYNHLQQMPLTPELLQTTFARADLPAPWWQPQSLNRETCFISTNDGHQLGLIYDAEQARGYLVVHTKHIAKSGEF